MGTGRLEAFTDGVIAIIITIMVLELKVPHDADVGRAARQPAQSCSTYVLSFVNVGIFWNNHHHMLHAADAVNGKVLWANLFLLFWLSLVPFVIRWIDETGLRRAADRGLRRGAGDGRASAICCWNGRSSPATGRNRSWR